MCFRMHKLTGANIHKPLDSLERQNIDNNKLHNISNNKNNI